jgi:hypothetical protein
MRVLAAIALSATALLAPQLSGADAAAPQSALATTPAPAPSLVVTSGGAPAATMTAQAAASAPVIDAGFSQNPDDIVCHMKPPPTGTRFGGSQECHTQRDWVRRMKESQRIVNGSQMMGLQGPLKDIAPEPPGAIAPPR